MASPSTSAGPSNSFVPPALQVVGQFRGETGVVEDDSGAGALFEEFKLGNRIDAVAPSSRPPGLYNPALGYQLQIPSHDVAGEKR